MSFCCLQLLLYTKPHDSTTAPDDYNSLFNLIKRTINMNYYRCDSYEYFIALKNVL